MFTWLRRIISGTKNFDLLGSVWFSNLDHLVGNIQYLQDDVDKPKQSGIANQSDKPNESKQRTEPSHNCAHHSARTCNCTGHDCIDNDNRNTSYFGSNSAKHFDDSVNDNEQLYRKLSNTKYYDDAGYRESSRGTEG
jgi:hypothetical protein